MPSNKIKIIFMGTPELGKTILERLVASKTYAPKLVITQQDKPVGRKHLLTPPPVKTCAQQHGIEVWQPEKLRDPEIIDRIRAWAPDIIVVAAYGKIIPQAIIDIPPRGILNVHTSLLPRHRGASPVQFAILSGDQETGVTIMRIDAGLDTGDIISQRTITIASNDTAETLMHTLAVIGAELLIETLPQWLDETITPKPQDTARATLAPTLTKEDGRIQTIHSAKQIEHMLRAFTPWPGVFMTLHDKTERQKTLKLIKARTMPCIPTRAPLGFSLMSAPDGKKDLLLHTTDGCLVLDIVQPEGKKPMSGHDFYLGYKNRLSA